MVLLTSTFDFIFLLVQKSTCTYSAQQAKQLILASSCCPPSPPNDMVCQKSSTTPNHGHIYTYYIYKFICLTAMNMKYLLRTSCTEYVQIYNDIQPVHTGYKREVHSFYITKYWINFPREPKMCIQILSVHTYSRVKMK